MPNAPVLQDDLAIYLYLFEEYMEKEKVYSELNAREKALIFQSWLEEHRAGNVAFFDLLGTSPLAEVVAVVSATSLRHARSLADGLLELCREHKFEFLRMEGYQTGLWILVDLNDVIVHIMQEAERDLYHLESLWRDAERLPATASAS